jgi:hypothetical protein
VSEKGGVSQGFGENCVVHVVVYGADFGICDDPEVEMLLMAVCPVEESKLM